MHIEPIQDASFASMERANFEADKRAREADYSEYEQSLIDDYEFSMEPNRPVEIGSII